MSLDHVVRKGRNIKVKAVSWAAGLVMAGAVVVPQTPVFTEYPLPVNSQPLGITSGPDGNLWFTESSSNKIGRITTAGVYSEFAVPSVNSIPFFITAGPDGNLWFTEYVSNKIGRITTAGIITEFSIPTTFSYPKWITAGADGNLWFTEGPRHNIGRITTGGAITEFFIPADTEANGITSGPDANLWFTALGVIGRITTSGVFTQFSLPALIAADGITSGPDGNLWFLDQPDSKIGRMTTGGVFTIFAIPSPDQGGPNCQINCGIGDQPVQITPGPDGNLWFTEQEGKGIGRITTSGVITEFQVPTAHSVPFGITSGPDGNMWFTESGANKIGRVTLSALPPPVPAPSSLLLLGTGLLILMSWSGWRALRLRSLGRRVGSGSFAIPTNGSD